MGMARYFIHIHGIFTGASDEILNLRGLFDLDHDQIPTRGQN